MSAPVTPPTPLPPAQPGSSAQPVVDPTPTPPPETVELRNIPITFGAPVEGRLIEGVIIEQSGADRLALQTRDGVIALRTTLPLQEGAALQLRITAETAPILAAIVQNTPAPPPTLTQAGTSATPVISPPPPIIATVTATLTTPPTANIPTLNTQASLTAQNGASAIANTPPPLGSRAPLRLLGARPAGAPSASTIGATPATPQGPETFEGAVTSANANGQVTVRSPLGELTFTPDRPLPLGANLMLQLTGPVETPTSGAASPQALAFAPYWSTLQSALSSDKGAAAGQSAIADAIPKPNTALTASAMFFMSALRMGDLRQWLGPDAMPVLEQSGLLAQMADEFASMQLLTLDSNSNEWRMFLIPFLTDGILQQLKLYIHDNNEGENDDPDTAAQRFVIEVEFNRLGPFQFEGLARPKQFDLIIRTERDIPDTMRDGIQTVFADTVTALGLTGMLTFKMAEPFLTQPRQSASPNGPEILI